MRTADISTNFHQCSAAETLCSAAVSPQLMVYVLDNSCTRTACSCTGVQIVSSHILTDVTVAVTKKLGGRAPPRSPWLLRLCQGCGSTLCDWSDRTVWQHPPPPPPKNFLLGSRRIPWPGRIGVGGARAPRGYATAQNEYLNPVEK